MSHIAFTIGPCVGNDAHDEHAPHEHAPHGYRPALPTCELLLELRRLLALGRRTERLVCRYLADLADRVAGRRDLTLALYLDELHAARALFGLGARESRERVRIGRALRQLPVIERALIEGELSYSRVRELTRVATAATEREWFELALRLEMRALERRVVAARARLMPAQERERTRRVTFELSEQECVLLERALTNARRACRADCTDGEALSAVVRDALSAQAEAANGNGGETVVVDVSGRGTMARDESDGGTVARDQGDEAVVTCDENGDWAQGGSERGDVTVEDSVRPWSWSDLGWDATQVGSSAANETKEESSELEGSPGGGKQGGGEEAERKQDLERAQWGEIHSRLLRAMGRGGRWSADRLIDASGLSAREVNVALTYLQLGGRIRRRADAFELL